MFAAGLGQESDAEGLDETGRRQRAGQRQHRPAQRKHQPPHAFRHPKALQQGLISEPFADKSVERRQGGNGDRADEKVKGRLRHSFGQPAHFFHVPRMGGMHHRPRAEEQQPFERGVVEGVIHPGNQTQRRQTRMAGVQKNQRRSQPHENDADVLDAVIGQQPFQVVFHQGVKHAQHRRDRAGGQNRHPPPQRRRAEEVKADARQPVDAGLDQHAGHQRRDVAGRHRMRRRQPDVQRDDAGLDAKTEQEKNEGGVALAGGHRRADVVQAAEAVIARRLKEQEEAENDAPGVNVRHDEKEHARLARLRLFMLKTDQAEGGQRHQFPGDEEKPDVVRHEEQGRGQQQRVVESAQHADILAPKEAPHVAE